MPRAGSVIVPLAPFSPRGSDAHSDPPAAIGDDQAQKPGQRKAKRVRLLLDTRTELTDEELKASSPYIVAGFCLLSLKQMSRANYVQDQEALKLEAARKKAQQENGRLIEEMIYGAPRGGKVACHSLN